MMASFQMVVFLLAMLTPCLSDDWRAAGLQAPAAMADKTSTSTRSGKSVVSRRSRTDMLPNDLDLLDSYNQAEVKRKKKKQKIGGGRRRPDGPLGPAGPSGPQAARAALSSLRSEMAAMVKEEVQKQTQILLADKCRGCALGAANFTGDLHSIRIDGAAFMPPEVAFTATLSTNLPVRSRTFTEVRTFDLGYGAASVQRGQSFKPQSGRFQAPRVGIYQFVVRLHVATPRRKGSGSRVKRRDHIRVLVCINSLCTKHGAIEHISGMHSNTKVFSISFAGFLQLEEGQYASLYVDNHSSRELALLNGSSFSGLLVGY